MLTDGLDREFGRICLPWRRGVRRTDGMTITICRMVHYTLSAEDAEKINRRRTTPGSITARLSGANPTWPTGAQAHIGNTAVEGQECAAMCVGTLADAPDGEVVAANLQVFLDGNDVFWATSRKEDANVDKKLPPTPGTWHWPVHN